MCVCGYQCMCMHISTHTIFYIVLIRAKKCWHVCIQIYKYITHIKQTYLLENGDTKGCAIETKSLASRYYTT